jgi:hypothetical protein
MSRPTSTAKGGELDERPSGRQRHAALHAAGALACRPTRVCFFAVGPHRSRAGEQADGGQVDGGLRAHLRPASVVQRLVRRHRRVLPRGREPRVHLACRRPCRRPSRARTSSTQVRDLSGRKAIGPGATPNNYKVGVRAGVLAARSSCSFRMRTTSRSRPARISPPRGRHPLGGLQQLHPDLTLGASANNPAVVAAGALAGGADDRANITDTQRQAALDAITPDLGPGQVAMPG